MCIQIPLLSWSERTTYLFSGGVTCVGTGSCYGDLKKCQLLHTITLEGKRPKQPVSVGNEFDFLLFLFTFLFILSLRGWGEGERKGGGNDGK